MMRLNIYVETNIGKRRSINEDNFCCNGSMNEQSCGNLFYQTWLSEECSAFGVFDGMGGTKCGEKASYISANLMRKYINMSKMAGNSFPAIRFFHEANREICAFHESYKVSLGSTGVVLKIVGNKGEITNIGDSRAYLFRNMNLIQLTVDHTHAELCKRIQRGTGTTSFEETKKLKDTLTQYLGIAEEEFTIQPAKKSFGIKDKDIILLCSDGLTDMLSDEKIGDVLMKNTELSQKGSELVLSALANGGEDNITIILIEVWKNQSEKQIK